MSTGEVIVKILSGGAVGYLTNLLAIKMLFKKYPLVGGDLISSAYPQIENNLTKIVEKSLSQTEISSLENESNQFKNIFNSFSDDLINQSLPKNIPDIELKDIPGYQTIIDQISQMLTENQSFIDNIDLEKILNTIDIKKLLESEDLKLIAQKVFPILSSTIVPEFKNMTLEIYDDIKEKTISEIFDPPTLAKIKGNFSPLLKELGQKIKEIEPQIDKAVKDLWQEINIDTIFEHLENNLKNHSIVEIIGIENKEGLIRELISHFIKFINSADGKEFLLKLSDSLINMTKEVDAPLLNFLMPILQVRIFNFLERNIPYLAENAKEWLRINKKEIEQIIEDSIEEYYTTQDLMGQFKLTVKDLIGLKISEYFQVVEKAIEKFETYIDKNATKDITEQLISFLESKKIGEIFTQLDLKKENLAEFFTSLINNYLPKIKTSVFDSMLNKQLGDIDGLFSVSLKDRFGEKLQLLLINKVKDFIFSGYIINKVEEIIPEKFDSFKDQSLESLLPKEKLDSLLGFLPMLVMFSQGKLIDGLFNEINKSMENKKLSDFASDNIQQLIKEQVKNLYTTQIPAFNTKTENIKINSLYEKVKSSEVLTQMLNNFPQTNLDKLHIYFKQKVVHNFANQMNLFSPQKLSQTISLSSSSNLQPLVWSGLVIGAILGFFFSFISFSETDFYTALLINIVFYAIIGILTNWIALGLLKPAGIFSKKKSELSPKIASFISNQVNNGEFINNNFSKSINTDLKNYVSENNYQNLEEILKNNQEIVSDFLLEKSFSFATSSIDTQNIANSLANQITDFKLSGISQEKFDYFVKHGVNKGESFLTNFIAKKILDYKEKDLSALPEKLKTEIESLTKIKIQEKSKEIINGIENIDIKEKLEELLVKFEGIINLDTKISNVYLPDEITRAKIIDYINSLIKDRIPDAIEKYIEKNFIEDELAPDKQISTLFNGDLIPFIRKNIYILLDTVIFGFGLDKLKDEKENISQKIIQGVKQANKDNFLYSLGESFLSIDKDIKEIVELIIDNKLEPYLQEKKSELQILLTGFIDFISQKKLQEIGLNSDILNSNNINLLVDKFVNNEKILTSINHSSTALVDNIFSLQISQVLRLIGINFLSDIPAKFTEQIKIVKNSVFESLESNNEGIEKIIDSFSGELINKIFFSQKLAPLFKGIEEDQIKLSVGKIAKDIFNTEAFNIYKEKFSVSIYEKIIDKKAEDFLNKESIENHIRGIISDLINDKQIQDNIKDSFKPLVLNLISQFNRIIPNDSKEYVLEIIGKSIMESMVLTSPQILESLNIDNNLAQNINNMSSKEIEETINSFSSPYLNKIIFSGWVGGLFGIITAVISSYQ